MTTAQLDWKAHRVTSAEEIAAEQMSFSNVPEPFEEVVQERQVIACGCWVNTYMLLNDIKKEASISFRCSSFKVLLALEHTVMTQCDACNLVVNGNGNTCCFPPMKVAEEKSCQQSNYRHTVISLFQDVTSLCLNWFV